MISFVTNKNPVFLNLLALFLNIFESIFLYPPNSKSVGKVLESRFPFHIFE